MKIAQIAPLYEAVPPKLYGGTERVVATLCDALTAAGHDVTLFAASGAQTDAEVVAVRDEPIRLDDTVLKSDLAAHLVMLDEVRKRVDEFDVLHFHVEMLHFPLFEEVASRTVTTIHNRLDIKDLPALYARWPQYGLVSISESQREPLPDARWLATVGHGIPTDQYAFTANPSGKYLAFLGRISREKRPDVAIELALQARIPLKIAAKIDAADSGYFNKCIKGQLGDPLVEFVGEIGDDKKSEFLGNALALLFPIDWPEPFGMVMIEAMACGTPVIAWDRGSVPEVIEDGVTGFIVNSKEQALEAIARVAELDRRAVRAAFEQRFAAETMARGYLDVYRKLTNPSPQAARATG